MEAYTQEQSILYLHTNEEHHFRGLDELFVFLEEFWYLSNQIALDKAVIGACPRPKEGVSI